MKVFKTLLLCLITLSHDVSFADDNSLQFSGIKGSENSLISMKVLTKAYNRLGIKIKYLPLPGERSLRTSNSGKVDGEVFRIANVSKRYTNLIQIPTSINTLPAIAFSKNKNISIDGWHSLRPYKIGIQVGIKFAERGTKKLNPVVVDSNEQLFRMLNSGRIDIAIASQVNGLKTLKLLKYKNIHALTPVIAEYPLYHYLHKKHASLVPRLNDVLIKMRSSNESQEIRAEYLEQLRR